MEITGHEDLRVQRTIKSIYTAFEAMIVAMPYRQITVTELARRAQINKKTFYRYYETLDDLLNEYQLRHAHAYREQIKDYVYPRDLALIIRSFFEYCEAQNEAFAIITADLSHAKIRQAMINIVKPVVVKSWQNSLTFNRLTPFEQQTLLGYIEQTELMVYQRWYQEGRQVPLETAITTAQRLIKGGVSQLLQIQLP